MTPCLVSCACWLTNPSKQLNLILNFSINRLASAFLGVGRKTSHIGMKESYNSRRALTGCGLRFVLVGAQPSVQASSFSKSIADFVCDWGKSGWARRCTTIRGERSAAVRVWFSELTNRRALFDIPAKGLPWKGLSGRIIQYVGRR